MRNPPYIEALALNGGLRSKQSNGLGSLQESMHLTIYIESRHVD